MLSLLIVYFAIHRGLKERVQLKYTLARTRNLERTWKMINDLSPFGNLARKIWHGPVAGGNYDRAACYRNGNWCSPFCSVSGGCSSAPLNRCGTVLDSPDYSYRAAMPRARASFPHPSLPRPSTSPFLFLVLFLFREAHAPQERRAHAQLLSWVAQPTVEIRTR